MVIAAALILTFFCFIAVAIPLLRNKGNSERDWSHEFDDSSPGSSSSRTMVKQLETDYRTGILSENDFHSLQGSFQGTTVMAGEATTEGASSLDNEIENRIAGLRGGKVTGADEIEEKIRQLRRTPAATGGQSASSEISRKTKARFCPQCGAKIQPGNRFCTQCGEQLT